ncbi:uncharacterized protein LOC113307660 [Papaver somniferum]|uniref:uncharacterized protein LOC113307660 n=1 Tax=Papaver somniferum TaxID=3469 RepID=UPI000E6F73E9|nr:uncharacterized protein LOC113307660 [Papaver somniferum]
MWFIWKRNLVEAMARIRRTRDIDQTEALALLLALQWIHEKQWSRIIVEGDNKTIMDAVKNKQLDSVRWEDKALLAECVNLLQNLKNIEVHFVQAADILAKYARKQVCNQHWYYNVPQCYPMY